MINQRITKLRQLMKERGIDLYIIPTSDFHQSEYVGSYFEARHYMSGFSGSAGTLIVREDEAYLWTDGRYFIQAEKELAGSCIQLMKMRTPGVPTIKEYIEKYGAGVIIEDMSNLNTNQIELIKQQNRIKNAISGQNMFGVNAIGNSYINLYKTF